eukprot:GILK01005561.1.p1 GENE.GILK01005561.1~~GILK01005561.1.p1  ORF type:complete len:468 (+),score=51.24 GILK01005561.1:59-1462(+)
MSFERPHGLADPLLSRSAPAASRHSFKASFIDAIHDITDPFEHFAGGLPVDPEDSKPINNHFETPTKKGTAGKWRTFLAIVKSFIGTGVLFLPKGFSNGGYIFSLIILLLVAYFSLICMLRLVKCREARGGTFGEIGEMACGPWARRAVNFSLVASQTGFCCAYIIFISKNARVLILTLSNCTVDVPEYAVALSTAAVLVPLVWVRKIAQFALSNLVADVFIIYTLIYIFINSSVGLAEEGHGAVQPFHWGSCLIFLGTAVYLFEGVGMILPISEAMAKKEEFPRLLSWSTLALVIVFSLFGLLNYIYYGDSVQPLAVSNLNPHSWPAQVILCVYCIALVLTYPLMFFPVVAIVEGMVFAPGPSTSLRKWKKNAFRVVLVFCTIVISIFGGSNFDNFISLIGSFCCVPLAFIYPALFHLRLFPSLDWKSKAANLFMIVMGALIMVFATLMAILSWQDGDNAKGPCDA